MSTQDDLLAVRNLVIKIFETNGRLVETGNALVRSAGLTTAWWQVLGALGYSPMPLPVAHIARNMGITRQAVQRVVDLLLEQGFVALQPNPHHQRAKLVVLTRMAALRWTPPKPPPLRSTSGCWIASEPGAWQPRSRCLAK